MLALKLNQSVSVLVYVTLCVLGQLISEAVLVLRGNHLVPYGNWACATN